MNLTVRIHDIEYVNKIAQGVTFAEEYNETLDSGSIRICHIGQIENLRPYDDVYIYESCPEDYEDTDNYFNNHIAYWRQGGNLHDGDKDTNGKTYDPNDTNATRIPFYRHLLVDNYAEEIVSLDAVDPITDKSGIFSYSIELFSETKGLEMVQLPHISVTQPLNITKKVDIYTYLTRFVNMYSPKYKTIDRSSTGETKKWKYTKKYSVAPELKEIFGGVYSQDFTLSNPTLKDVLSTLMITKDMIPYVKDNVIYAKAISERTGTYNIQTEKDSGRINMVVGQMSSNDYCDGVRRQYSNALSQDGTCNFIEYLGFRNKNSAIMSFDEMRVETTHSLYKIKKMYMCYYKNVSIHKKWDKEKLVDTYLYKGLMFCKQDITPLIKLNSEWDLLSQDYQDLEKNPPKNINDLSKYKLTTVTYDLGGNSITGWGNRYKEPKEGTLTVYDIEKSYLENLFTYLDSFNSFGSLSEKEIIDDFLKSETAKNMGWDEEGTYYVVPSSGIDDAYAYEKNFTDIQKLKTLFFEIEYEGFYDGALIHSRDKGNDNLFQNDNQSSALTLLEKDGYSQKEKLNRFANKTITMKGRLDGDNYGVENLLKLGQTGVIGQDDDVIIYRREYSIFDNYILVSYAGVNDYVLKNFYTSVYARYRTNQLMSYNESTTRAETRKVMLLLSKDKKFKDEEDTFFNITENGERVETKLLFSMFDENKDNIAINSAVISVWDESKEQEKKHFYVDEQTFTSGNSLCFNVAMIDNASGGNFIEKYVSDFDLLLNKPSYDEKYIRGTSQDWYKIVNDIETGAIDDFNFEISNREIMRPTIGSSDNITEFYNYTKSLPKKESNSPIAENVRTKMNISESLYKDNKEKIDMTLQIEPIVDPKIIKIEEYQYVPEIVLGESFMRLSNLSLQDNIKRSIATTDEASKYVSLFSFEINVTSDSDGSDIVFNIIPAGTDDKDKFKQQLIEYIRDSGNETVNGVDGDNNPIMVPYVDVTATIDATSDKLRFVYRINKLACSKEEDKLFLIGEGLWADDTSNDVYYPEAFNLYNDIETDKIYGIDAEWDTETKMFECAFRYGGKFWDKNADLGSFNMQVIEKKESTSIIEKNMFIQFGNDYIDKTYSYKVLSPDANKELFSNYSVNEIFSVKKDGPDSYIRVTIPSDQNDVKSIIYWYFDFDSAYKKNYADMDYVYDYYPSQSGYRFVFGVNLTEEDHDRGYVDIYITKTTHRDERVFDSVGRQVGIVHNCVDENGNYEEPTYYSYDENENNPTVYSANVQIEPEGSGVVKGSGLYYDGEIANLTFTPNEGNIFYRWKLDDQIIGQEASVSSVVNGNKTFIAQCGVKHNIWDKKQLSNASGRSSNDIIALYKFKEDQISGDVLKINATITVSGGTALVLPFIYSGSFEINTSKNVSESTASRATFSFDGGRTTLNVWFDESTKTIYAKGIYRSALLIPAPISIYVNTLSAVFAGNLQKTSITLDFSNNIDYMVVIAKNNDNVYLNQAYYAPEDATNQVIVDNVITYNDDVSIIVYPKEGYTAENDRDNPFQFKMGVDMRFAPSVTEIKFSGPSIEERGNGYYGWYSINEGADQWGAYVENKNDFEVICEAVWDDGLMEHQTVETIIANSTKPIVLQARLNETLLQGAVYAKFRFVKDGVATDWTDRLPIAS